MLGHEMSEVVSNAHWGIRADNVKEALIVVSLDAMMSYPKDRRGVSQVP
jgi:hypothetical protein